MPHLSKRNATTLFKKNNIQSVWGQLEGSPKTTSQEASTSHAKSCRNVLSILPFGIHGINPFGNHPHPLGSKVPNVALIKNVKPGTCLYVLFSFCFYRKRRTKHLHPRLGWILEGWSQVHRCPLKNSWNTSKRNKLDEWKKKHVIRFRNSDNLTQILKKIKYIHPGQTNKKYT